MNPDDIRMAHPGDDRRLADEAPDNPGLIEKRFAEELHGNRAIGSILPGLVDLSHPARSNHAMQSEVVVRDQGLLDDRG